MKPARQLGILLALAAGAVLPLAGQQSRIYREGNSWVEEVTASLRAGKAEFKRLRVNTFIGSVEVTGADRPDITYTVKKRVYLNSEEDARRVLQAYRLSASAHGGLANFQARSAAGLLPRFAAELSIQVPRGLKLAHVSTEGGNVLVRNLEGRVEAQSGGGNVQLAEIGGPVTATTSGGSVEVSNVPREIALHTGGGGISISGKTGPVIAESAGGDIVVGSPQGAARLQTGAGSIRILSCENELQASTAGGNIEVGEVHGHALLKTLGGSIRVGAAKGTVTASTGAGTIELYKLMQGARAETGSGFIVAQFLGPAEEDSQLQTSLGDIVVYLGPQTRFKLEAAIQMANGHRIRSEFPGVRIESEGGGWGPHNLYAEGEINGGGPVLKVSTISGNIEIRRAGH